MAARDKFEYLLEVTGINKAKGALDEAQAQVDRLDKAAPSVDVTADADATIAAMRDVLEMADKIEAAAPTMDVKVDASGAKAGLDDVAKSADSSKSVLANMVGNATQDLGALGGVAGSAGVAIGQMGEYMVDAANSGDRMSQVLSSFSKVALPIAGIALAVKAVSDQQQRFAESAERSAENVDAWTEALEGGGNAADNYVDALKDMDKVLLDVTRSQSNLENIVAEANSNWYTLGGGVGFLGKALGVTSDEVKDITPALTAAGVNAEEWSRAMSGGVDAAERFAGSLTRTSLSADDQKAIMEALRQGQEDYATALENTAARQAFLTGITEDERPRLDAMAAAYVESSGMIRQATSERADAEQAAADRIVESRERGAAAADLAADAIRAAADESIAAAREEADAHTAAADQLIAAVDARRAAADAQFALNDAYRDFKDAHAAALLVLADEDSTLEDLAAAQDNLAQAGGRVADSQVRLASEAAIANGAALTAVQTGDVWRSSMIDQAAAAEGPLRGAILSYIDSVEDIPDSTLTDIQAAIDRGDIAEANRLLADASKKRTAEIAATAQTGAAEAALNNLARDRRVRITVDTVGGDPVYQRGTAMRFASMGGPVYPGNDYLVGEQGPEVVRFGAPATVIDHAESNRLIAEAVTPTTIGAPVTVNHYWPNGVSPGQVIEAQRRDRARNGVR